MRALKCVDASNARIIDACTSLVGSLEYLLSNEPMSLNEPSTSSSSSPLTDDIEGPMVSPTGVVRDDDQQMSSERPRDDDSSFPDDGVTTAAANDRRALRNAHGDRAKRQEKLTLEDCVDMDVDVLTTVLERSFHSLKRDTLDFFVDARTRFKSRALHELSQERRVAERKEQAKNEEVELLNQEFKEEKGRTERLMLAMSRMADAVGSAHRRKHSYRVVLTIYHAWVYFAKSEKTMKHKMAKAWRYYCDTRLKRRALVRWVEHVREQIRTCARERFQAKLDVARSAIENQYSQKCAALEDENSNLREKLKVESEMRSKLEEDMQQAFMRGVCALNMEALSVMKRGMPPNGVHPFLNATDLVSPTEAEHESDRFSAAQES